MDFGPHRPAEMLGPFLLAGLIRWGVALSPLVWEWEWEQRGWKNGRCLYKCVRVVDEYACVSLRDCIDIQIV